MVQWLLRLFSLIEQKTYYVQLKRMCNKLLNCELTRVTIYVGSFIKAEQKVMAKAHVLLRQEFTGNTQDTNTPVNLAYPYKYIRLHLEDIQTKY